jgi:hypothetical protein
VLRQRRPGVPVRGPVGQIRRRNRVVGHQEIRGLNLPGIGISLTAAAPARVITPPVPSWVCSLVICGDRTTSPVMRS